MFRSFYFLIGFISVACSPRAIRQVKRKKAYCPVYPRTSMIEFYRLCLPLAGHQYMELVLRKITCVNDVPPVVMWYHVERLIASIFGLNAHTAPSVDMDWE